MNKSELVAKIAAGAAITKKQAEAALDATTQSVTDALVAGDGVTLPGFCNIKKVERAERPGRNPITGTALVIPKRNGVKFTAGKALQAAINV